MKAKWLITSLLVVCLTLFLACTVYAEENLFSGKQQQLVNQGDKLMQEGKGDEAINSFNQALAADKKGKNNDSIYMRIGVVYASTGKSDKAIEAWKQALVINKNNAGAYYNLGTLALMQNDFAGAESNFQQVIKLDSENVDVHWQLIKVYLATNKPDQAIKEAQTAISLDPKNPNAYWQSAVLYMQTGNYAQGEKQAEEVIKLVPDAKIQVYFNMGAIYYDKQQYQKTIDYWKKVATLDAKNGDIMYSIGRVYLENIKDKIKAKEYLKKAVQINPQDKEAQEFLAKIK